MELILIRHARAHERDTSRWLDDADRPLTKGGARDFRRLAKALRRWIERPEMVLASRFVRAWRTAEILHKDGRWPAPVECPELASDAVEGCSGYEALLRQHQSATRIALVGHEPHLGEFAELLLGARQGSLPLRKGAVAVFDIESLKSGVRGSLRQMVDPTFPRRRR
ncbi:MAG: hypothetical protein EXS00_00870 [Phycisphaerales bacterium]|nr:hypothetical protein [Phycisphaerales bacterium]